MSVIINTSNGDLHIDTMGAVIPKGERLEVGKTIAELMLEHFDLALLVSRNRALIQSSVGEK